MPENWKLKSEDTENKWVPCLDVDVRVGKTDDTLSVHNMLNKQRLILIFSFLWILDISKNPLFVGVRTDKKTFIISQHTTTLYSCSIYLHIQLFGNAFLSKQKFCFFSLFGHTFFPIKTHPIYLSTFLCAMHFREWPSSFSRVSFFC